MSGQKDTTDIEALVMEKLSYASPSPAKDEGLSLPDTSRKRTHKRRNRKLSSSSPPVPDDVNLLTENFAHAAKEAENRALRLALTGSRGRRREQPVHRSIPTTAAKVVQAADMKEQAPARTPHFQANNDANGKDVSADAAEIVEKYRREVGRFGSRALHKSDRKKYETSQLQKLGCRKPKNEKMPIGILTKKRKYQKIRERKKKEMDTATGMLVRAGRK